MNSTKGTDKTVVLLDMFQYLLATFMIKFFFGSELKGQTLDGVRYQSSLRS
jgi:hypothetical protein